MITFYGVLFFDEKLYNLEVKILAVTKILREWVSGCSSLFSITS